MFKNLRPLARIAVELRRIATVMEYFAIEDARRNNRIFVMKRPRFTKDESELLHTDEATIAALRLEEQALMLQQGYPQVEERDLIDEEV